MISQLFASLTRLFAALLRALGIAWPPRPGPAETVEPFLGEIMLFAGSTAPNGWMLCNGQLLDIGDNVALYTLLGTTFGGDGTLTFGLPNLQGRIPVGQGQGPAQQYVFGAFGGEETHTLLVPELPAHSHNVATTSVPSTGKGNTNTPSGTTYLADETLTGVNNCFVYAPPNAGSPAALAPLSVMGFGGEGAHDNVQPVLAMNYCIAVAGIFPSKSAQDEGSTAKR